MPTIAAVNGYALGGGCECVLATDYRLATPDLRIGLPETKLLPCFWDCIGTEYVIQHSG